MENQHTLNVTISGELLAKIKKHAEKNNLSLSASTKSLIYLYFIKENKSLKMRLSEKETNQNQVENNV